jgi:hypothetical protein
VKCSMASHIVITSKWARPRVVQRGHPPGRRRLRRWRDVAGISGRLVFYPCVHVGSQRPRHPEPSPGRPLARPSVGVLGLAVFLIVYGNVTSFVRGKPRRGRLARRRAWRVPGDRHWWARSFGLLPADLGIVWRTAPRVPRSASP